MNHSVLAHKDHSFSAQGLADLVHLLGADIVDADDEDRLVFVEKCLELVKVDSLGSLFSAPHVFFGVKIGCLRAGESSMIE